MALLTQKAFAARIRKTPQYVNKLVTRGVIRLVKGKVDPKQALAAIAAQRRVGRVIKAKPRQKGSNAHGGGRPAGTGGAKGGPHGDRSASATKSLTFWRSRLEQAKAETAELELKKATGQLLPADQVRAAWTRALANVRTRLRRLPRALCHQLGGLSAVEIDARLLEALDRELGEMARDPLGEAVSRQPSAKSPCGRLQRTVPSTRYPVPSRSPRRLRRKE